MHIWPVPPQAADWWSTGVLIFELVAGVCPFYSEDRMEMYRQIVAANVKCPQHFTPVSSQRHWQCKECLCPLGVPGAAVPASRLMFSP